MSNIDYLLVIGVLVVGGIALSLALLQALIAMMEIRSILFSLPVG